MIGSVLVTEFLCSRQRILFMKAPHALLLTGLMLECVIFLGAMGAVYRGQNGAHMAILNPIK